MRSHQAMTELRSHMRPVPNPGDARLDLFAARRDDAAIYERIDEVLDDMERYVATHHGRGGASWRSGDFTAGAMLEFKGRHRDATLTDWTVADLRAVLLDWFPAYVHTDDDVLRDMPASAAVFFDYLADAGSLTGDPADELKAACDSLGPDFLAACRDPERWGSAKARLIALAENPPAPDR